MYFIPLKLRRHNKWYFHANLGLLFFIYSADAICSAAYFFTINLRLNSLDMPLVAISSINLALQVSIFGDEDSEPGVLLIKNVGLFMKDILVFWDKIKAIYVHS